ncbi:MAG TPA: thioredoxin domain-containing protein [Gemmatimonadales bacterium]|jgi:protein-disulfide isomerase|nr:thioredoxin domain-containing protein [Gemmatimonadales bacterium]
MARSQTPFYVAIGVIVVAGIVFLVTKANRPSISIPANVVVTAADTSGFRGYILGSPSAPVEVTEYADFECPHCAVFDQVQFPDIKARLIDAGKLRWRFRDYPIDNLHSDARLAAHAAACANDQNKFWEMKVQLFARQNDWALQKNAESVLADIAKSIGLDVNAWTDCMKSAKYAGRIQASFDEGNKVGVQSTPNFLVAGRIYDQMTADQMVKLVDSLITAQPRSGPPAAPVTGQ